MQATTERPRRWFTRLSRREMRWVIHARSCGCCEDRLPRYALTLAGLVAVGLLLRAGAWSVVHHLLGY
jgi:hypothetical protein